MKCMMMSITVFTLAGSNLPCAAQTHSGGAAMREFGVRPPEMILVSGGTFLMGSPVSDATSAEYHADERPQRTIRVDDFYISRFLVTAEDFSLFMNERGEQ